MILWHQWKPSLFAPQVINRSGNKDKNDEVSAEFPGLASVTLLWLHRAQQIKSNWSH